MTTEAKCDKPAMAAVKLGDAGEFIPVCESGLYKARARSAKAGKKPIPKGTPKAAALDIAGTNRDDVLPIHVRALSVFEKESGIGCYEHLLPTGAP